jgi:hypothetical protein
MVQILGDNMALTKPCPSGRVLSEILGTGAICSNGQSLCWTSQSDIPHT